MSRAYEDPVRQMSVAEPDEAQVCEAPAVSNADVASSMPAAASTDATPTLDAAAAYTPEAPGAMAEAERRLGVRLANQRLAEGARSGIYEQQDIDFAQNQTPDTISDIQDTGRLPGEVGQQHHTAEVANEPERAADPDNIRPTETQDHRRLHQGDDELEENEWEDNNGMQEVPEDQPTSTFDRPEDADTEDWLRDNDPDYEPEGGNYEGTTDAVADDVATDTAAEAGTDVAVDTAVDVGVETAAEGLGAEEILELGLLLLL